MVEEAHTQGVIHGVVNSNFLALILKKKSSKSFKEYRPISLCNTLYKIISKTIVDRIKVVLSRFISTKNSGFLQNCSIHDAICTTQEIIHTIYSRHVDATIMKVEIKKAYDHIDWGFMRLILQKIGVDNCLVDWIMSCVSDTLMMLL